MFNIVLCEPAQTDRWVGRMREVLGTDQSRDEEVLCPRYPVLRRIGRLRKREYAWVPAIAGVIFLDESYLSFMKASFGGAFELGQLRVLVTPTGIHIPNQKMGVRHARCTRAQIDELELSGLDEFNALKGTYLQRLGYRNQKPYYWAVGEKVELAVMRGSVGVVVNVVHEPMPEVTVSIGRSLKLKVHPRLLLKA